MVMRGRARPVGALSAVGTLAWRAMLKIKHVPFQLFDVTMTPIMFTLLFTFVFGGALAGSPGEYLQFFLPGILVQTVMFNSVYSGMGLSTVMAISAGPPGSFRPTAAQAMFTPACPRMVPTLPMTPGRSSYTKNAMYRAGGMSNSNSSTCTNRSPSGRVPMTVPPTVISPASVSARSDMRFE